MATTSNQTKAPTHPGAADKGMVAVIQECYGSPADVLKLQNIDRPRAGDHEVLVRVQAASAHSGDWRMVRGQPYLIRLMGFGLRKPKRNIPGNDLAGRVEAVGKGVTQFRPGDEVFGWGNGTFAQSASVPEDQLVLKPANLTFEQAATVPISSFTAIQALRDKGQIRAGQKALIIGASGGVGTFAVQIAKSYGAEVTGVCSTRNVDMVRSIGADHVVDYTREDFVERGERYDLILDMVGNRSLSDCRRALSPSGTLVVVGGTGGRWLGGLDRTLRAVLMSPFVGQKLVALISKENKSDLVALKDLCESGRVTPVIDRTYPLTAISEAIQYLETAHTRGKVVITV